MIRTKYSLIIRINTKDIVVTLDHRIIFVKVAFKLSGLRIKLINPTRGSYPDVAMNILMERQNIAMIDTIGITRLVPEYLKIYSIKSVQAICCCNPQKTLPIL